MCTCSKWPHLKARWNAAIPACLYHTSWLVSVDSRFSLLFFSFFLVLRANALIHEGTKKKQREKWTLWSSLLITEAFILALHSDRNGTVKKESCLTFSPLHFCPITACYIVQVSLGAAFPVPSVQQAQTLNYYFNPFACTPKHSVKTPIIWRARVQALISQMYVVFFPQERLVQKITNWQPYLLIYDKTKSAFIDPAVGKLGWYCERQEKSKTICTVPI